MPSYKVTWVIDIDAEAPREAALEVAKVMAEEIYIEGSSASGPVFFEVEDLGTGITVHLDLEYD